MSAMLAAAIPAPEPQFHLIARPVGDRDATPKYWTGKMLDSWPEYSRDPEKAAACNQRVARQAVAQFNARTVNLVWEAEIVAV